MPQVQGIGPVNISYDQLILTASIDVVENGRAGEAVDEVGEALAEGEAS